MKTYNLFDGLKAVGALVDNAVVETAPVAVVKLASKADARILVKNFGFSSLNLSVSLTDKIYESIKDSENFAKVNTKFSINESFKETKEEILNDFFASIEAAEESSEEVAKNKRKEYFFNKAKKLLSSFEVIETSLKEEAAKAEQEIKEAAEAKDVAIKNIRESYNVMIKAAEEAEEARALAEAKDLYYSKSEKINNMLLKDKYFLNNVTSSLRSFKSGKISKDKFNNEMVKLIYYKVKKEVYIPLSCNNVLDVADKKLADAKNNLARIKKDLIDLKSLKNKFFNSLSFDLKKRLKDEEEAAAINNFLALINAEGDEEDLLTFNFDEEKEM